MRLSSCQAWLLLIAAIGPSRAAAQLPTLQYDPPPNFYHSAITPPDQYTSNEVNASLQVYQFRSFTGDLAQQFQRTLLRDWIDPQYQESNVAATPMWSRPTVPGAQAVAARFTENVAGTLRQRMRVLIVAGQAAAIVDASANSMESWQRVLPALNAMSATWRVVAAPAAPAAPPSAAARVLAGLYMGMKGHYVVDLNRTVGNGTWQKDPHFYLLSPNGRVYRGYNVLVTSSADVGRFDFDAAARTEPESTGWYSVEGNQLVFQFGGQPAERLTTTMRPGSGTLTVDGVSYVKQ
jgi:hypothetical protein